MPESIPSHTERIYDLIAANYSAYCVEEANRTIDYFLFLEPCFKNEGGYLCVDWLDEKRNIHSDRHEWNSIKCFGLIKDSDLSTSQRIDQLLRQKQPLV